MATDYWTTPWSTEDLKAWSWWETFLAVSWKSHVALDHEHDHGTSHSHNENGLHPAELPQVQIETKVTWNENWATLQGPQEEAQREARSQSSKSMWVHDDEECCEVSEKVGALHHRWSAAAEDFTTKTSESGNTKSCVGRDTMLRIRTVPIFPHVAEDESHVGAGEAGEAGLWAGLGSKIHTIDGLRHCDTARRCSWCSKQSSRQDCENCPPGGPCSSTASDKLEHVETRNDHADEVLIEAQAEERIAEQRPRTHATKTYSQWLETDLGKRSKSRTSAHPHGLPEQHHTAAEHAGTHGRMVQQVEQGHGGTPHPFATTAFSQTSSTLHHATQLDSRTVRHALSSMKGNRARGVDG